MTFTIVISICFGSLQSAVDLGVVAGQTYLVRVSGFSGAIGGFNLRSAMVAAPNDGCAGAINFVPGTSTTGVTTGSTSGGTATCGTSDASPDLWYRMLATCTGTLRRDTCGSPFDTVLSVHTACPGTTGNQLACNDDSGQAGSCPGSLQSFIDINVYANATYYIRVSGYNGNTGFFRLNSAYLMNSGADNSEQKYNAYNAFQTDPKISVFIGQNQAARDSIPLYAASTTISVEPDWVPGNNDQMLDRMTHFSKKVPCVGYFATLRGSIDEDIQKANIRKRDITSELGLN